MKLKKYTIEFKLKIISLIPKIGTYTLSKLYGIDRKSLRDWTKRKDEFNKIKNKKKSFRLPGGGTKPKKPELEIKISEFLNRCNEIEIPVTTGMIIDEICRLDPQMKEKSRKSLRKWYYRFLKRFNLNKISN